MPRTIPPGRFDDVVRNATEEFIARGYRRTQMSDIANAVGVSKATLYLYVESKAALFALCREHADTKTEIPLPTELPVTAATLLLDPTRAAKRIEEAAALPRLHRALGVPRADDIAAELQGIIGELYDVTERNCRTIKLLDRCWDHPDLGGAWQAAGREGPRRILAEYVALRMRAGQLRSDLEPRLAARLIIESVATWAMHIKWDRAPEPFEPVSTRQSVIEFIVRGLAIGEPSHSEERS